MATNNNSSINDADSRCHMHISSHHSSCYLLPISIIVLIFSIILLVNLVGNAIVVTVIISKRRMHTFTNWLICNLAVADLSVALFCLPLEIPLEITNHKWIYGRFFCRIFYPLQSSTIYGSVFTLVVLSCSRYWAILHPFRTQPTTLIAKILIAGTWVVSILLVTPYIMVLDYDDDGHCAETWEPPQRQSYTIATFTLQYVLPLAAIIVAYTLIIYDLMVRKNPSASHADKRKEKENRKLVKLLLIITLTFALCVLPYHVVALSIEFGYAGSFKYIEDVSLASYILLYLNSAFNPIIYNVFSSNFRIGFSESFRRTSSFFSRTSSYFFKSERSNSASSGITRGSITRENSDVFMMTSNEEDVFRKDNMDDVPSTNLLDVPKHF